MKAPFALSVLVTTCALSMACSSQAPEESVVATDTGSFGEQGLVTKVEPDGSFWVEENFFDFLDSDKSEAVRDAVRIVTSRANAVGGGDLGVAPDDAAEDMNKDVDYGRMAVDAEQLLRERIKIAASHGIHWSKVIPTAGVVVVGGSWTKSLKIFSGGGGSLMLVVIPKWVGHVNPRDREITWRFRFSAGITAVGNFNAFGGAKGAGGGLESVASVPRGKFRLGAGLVWGDLTNAKDLRGLVVGVSGSTPWFGFANNFKMLAFIDPSSFQVKNVVGTISKEWGALPTEVWDAQLAVGAAISGEPIVRGMMEAMGFKPEAIDETVGRTNFDGPERKVRFKGRPERPAGGWAANGAGDGGAPAAPAVPVGNGVPAKDGGQ